MERDPAKVLRDFQRQQTQAIGAAGRTVRDLAQIAQRRAEFEKRAAEKLADFDTATGEKRAELATRLRDAANAGVTGDVIAEALALPVADVAELLREQLQ